jgi:hypothetical protein
VDAIGEPGTLQGMQGELHIVRVVFDQQELDGLALAMISSCVSCCDSMVFGGRRFLV